MYTTKISFAILFVLLALFITTLTVEGQLTGAYPPFDTPPPPVASWTALVDQSKLPPAPIRASTASCGATTVTTDVFCVWPCTGCLRPESDFDRCPQKNDWALTFDDGPTEYTLRVLDALNSRGIKATFFVIGSRVVQNPTILKQVVDAGHQIGVHTWSHSPLTTQTTEEIIAEIKWTEMAIKEAVNLTPKWARPPLGDCDDRVRGILTQLGYKLAFWEFDTTDWKSNTDPTFDLNWIPGNFSQWVQNNNTGLNGHASLEHDAFDKTSSMASQAMDIVLNAKFNPESISVCLGNDQPYLENVQLLRSSPHSAVPINATNTVPTSTIVSTVVAVATNPTKPVNTGEHNTIGSNGASSIKKISLLYFVCGLLSVGTYYF